MSLSSLSSLYKHPYFHGIQTIQEAEAIRKASAEESGNPDVHIWFLLETENRGPAGRYFKPTILCPVNGDDTFSPVYGSCNECSDLSLIELPIYQFVEFLDEPMPDEVISCRVEAYQVLNESVRVISTSMFRKNLVKRRNPHDLAQLARATIFDNLNKCNCGSMANLWNLPRILVYSENQPTCCDRLLSLEIDQLEITVSEKLMMKKLIPGAQIFKWISLHLFL